MNEPPRRVAAALSGAVFIGAAALALHQGWYGWTLFAAIPVALGFFGAWWAGARSAGRAAAAGMLTAAAGAGSLLLLGMEGAICIIMALPLVLPLGALGGCLFYTCQSKKVHAGGAAMLLFLPVGTLGWDIQARPPVFEVRSAIEVAAAPEKVWNHVVTFSELPPPTEWYFRAGVAWPQRARIEGSGPGAVRYCEFSTGPFVEPIEVWDEPRLLRFRVSANPPPMHEWSPYAHVVPRHLRGYFLSDHGQFRLTPLGANRTLLEGTTWYQHGLWPAQYWRYWSDAIIHRIHLRVLRHIAKLAESE